VAVGELRPFATISEIAVTDEMQLRLKLATAGGGDRDGARAYAAAATAMPSVEESSAQIAAMQRERAWLRRCSSRAPAKRRGVARVGGTPPSAALRGAQSRSGGMCSSSTRP
jgi:hypothetical protein